jgi:putative pyruvate formate lyase activating enzyme
VTPTHYLPSIACALKPIKASLNKPVVYNCSGYENIALLEECKDIIDIFLTDIKYKSNILSKKYSSCENYFEVAIKCLKKMVEITGSPIIENGIMTRGTVVRHLVLPGCKSDSIEILSYLKENFDKNDFLVSLMCQYTPNEACACYPEINRRLTKLEYQRVCEVFEKTGFPGYLQESSSASSKYVPPFSEKGEFLEILFR